MTPSASRLWGPAGPALPITAWTWRKCLLAVARDSFAVPPRELEQSALERRQVVVTRPMAPPRRLEFALHRVPPGSKTSRSYERSARRRDTARFDASPIRSNAFRRNLLSAISHLLLECVTPSQVPRGVEHPAQLSGNTANSQPRGAQNGALAARGQLDAETSAQASAFEPSPDRCRPRGRHPGLAAPARGDPEGDLGHGAGGGVSRIVQQIPRIHPSIPACVRSEGVRLGLKKSERLPS